MAGRVTYLGNIVTNGLVLDLDATKRESYPLTGSTWFDLSNRDNNGTFVNNPAYTGSDYGSIAFNGTSSYVNLSTMPGSSFTLISSSFTVDMWVYITSNNAGLISSNQSPTIGGQYALVRRNNLLIVSFYRDLYGAALPTGSWVNVVHTHNFTNQTSSLYQQGVLTASASMASSPLITSASLLLGTYFFGGAYLQGNMSNVKIYNRALSQAEVTQNFNAYRTRYGV